MDDRKPAYYAIIPADVRYDDRIPANAKLLYGEVSALIGAEGYCFASNQYFAKIYGMSCDSITRLFKKLEDHGYIKREVEKDKSGQVIGRKIYLSVSMPQIQPPDNFTDTPLQNNREGTCKKDGDTNTSITDIEKENKKEKAMPLSGEQLGEMFVAWIREVSRDDWTSADKNLLYKCLAAFYKPRENKKQQPSRSETAVKTLLNRLGRLSNGDIMVMCEMLERSTIAGWKSVFALNGESRYQRPDPAAPEHREGRKRRWL